ncbi:MAG TPA: TIM-barrel domain-containing protein [Gemmatimonadaceae bacterium]|nr:TIM-barrel domain-containing protein [Gemmatimonadaceae bacterium]
MSQQHLSRRDAIKSLGALGASAVFAGRFGVDEAAEIIVAGKPVEISVWSLSATTARITVMPIENGATTPVAFTGALVDERLGRSVTRTRDSAGVRRVRAGDMSVRFTDGPPTLHIDNARGEVLQTLVLSARDPGMSFALGSGPLLGLGEGGPQFDRRGSADPMRNGQGGFRLATHGTRAPVQWLIGTADGWAMFIHQPYGAFDFTGATGKFTPPAASALPLDVFIVASRDPKVVMREYARITGLPETPPKWAFGYMQSHRTLGGPDEIMGVARTFREKKLPCDALIWLGTEFAPSGWNTRNGEFTWHTGNFPNPKQMMDALHAMHFRTVVHVVIEGRRLTGTVNDPCTAPALPSGRTPDDRWPPDRQVSCYWPVHKTAMDMGVDGWWPDQGDGLDGPSRLNRHRMYWEGTQQLKPNERPFALHRNASPGIQRYGGFIWSGDVQARWETLATHVSVAINTGLSGFPYWGTDIGGFNPTAEYTGELHARWFQFGAFCPSFRSHGRNWHLKLPWGWDGGDGGPFEAGQWRAAPEELQNKNVEAVARKYLELRYRLMPYVYTAMREARDSGLPLMRALWLHHADDPVAVARGDEFLWGSDMLVAPVVEKGATVRKVYLPRGAWFDFWTEERADGGREIERAVDIMTTPLYVRAGAVIPMGPVRQYAQEPSDEPLTLAVYPGADGVRTMYDDDGISFNYRRGEWMGLQMRWNDRARTLTLELERGSRMLSQSPMKIDVRVAGATEKRGVEFSGRRVVVAL